MFTFSILTILVGIITIIVNIGIAIYNAGKNRKIYEIETISTNSPESVNQKLKKGDYTILYVGPGNHINSRYYV